MTVHGTVLYFGVNHMTFLLEIKQVAIPKKQSTIRELGIKFLIILFEGDYTYPFT